MITGKQIREARALLNLTSAEIARRTHLNYGTIIRAQSVDGEAPITADQAAKIESVLKAAGVEFIPENGGGAGVRLRKG